MLQKYGRPLTLVFNKMHGSVFICSAAGNSIMSVYNIFHTFINTAKELEQFENGIF